MLKIIRNIIRQIVELIAYPFVWIIAPTDDPLEDYVYWEKRG